MTTPTASGSLHGVRVLDLSRVLAGPLCTQMLADHGAEVIKVEPPAGDETRTWGPPFVTETMSAYHAGLNRNKANLCLDLSEPEGRRVLEELLEDSDVLVENFKAGTLEKWGFPDAELAGRFPRLIHCRITGFGTDGPMGAMPGYDAVLQAYGGLMSINGEPSGPPLRVGVPIVDMVTGIHAFSGILLALHERHTSGRGQLVDCALLDTAISLLHPHSPAYLASGEPPRRTGSAHPSIAPYDTFDTRDGPIFIGAGNDRQFHRLSGIIGLPELTGDPRFATNAERVRNVAALRALLAPAIGCWARQELGRALLAGGVPATPVHDVGEALDDPQTRHREMLVELDGYRGTGIPVKLGRSAGSVRTKPPERGADTIGVLGSLLGYSRARIEELVDAGIVHTAGVADPTGR